MTSANEAGLCLDNDAVPPQIVGGSSILMPCQHLFGDCQIRQAPPRIVEIERAVYIPQTGSILESRWGVYGADGRLVEEAAYTRGPGRVLVGQSEHLEIPPDLDVIHEEMIYGGAMQAHYGHFLLALLPRFWIDFSAHPERKILLHSSIDLEVMFTIGFIREIFGALGLDRSRFVVLDRPSVVDRLIVPEALFQELGSAAPLFARLCETINARFNMPVPRTKGAVYLSKENLTSGVWGVANEHRISAALAAKGVDIVFPERIPLREQMTLFERYETICGLTGSALHTSLFARARNRIVGLGHNTFVVSNHMMIDRLKENDAAYFFPGNDMANLGPKGDFNTMFECPEPERVAEELFALF